VDLREAPIGKASNDGGDKLSKAERKEQYRRRTFHNEEAVRPSDENASERLRDDGDLQVNDHVQLRVVVVLMAIRAIGQILSKKVNSRMIMTAQH
jgi:hypothetical protein